MSEIPESPVVVRAQSTPGVGSQNVIVSIGPGVYEVLSMQLDIDTHYAQKGSIGVRYTRSDSETIIQQYNNGWLMDGMPLTLRDSRIAMGPGSFIGTVSFDASETSTFVVVYRRLRQ